MTSENIGEWFEIVNRILCDNIPESVDLTFLHAETKDNESSCFHTGAKLYSSGFTSKVGITGVDASVFEEMNEKYTEKNPSLADKIRRKLKPGNDGTMVGYLGFKHWKRNLRELGVKKEDILVIEPSFDYTYLNTNTEARGLINFCRQQGIETVCITSPPFHQVRSYISDISILLQEGATGLKLYSRPGEPLNWNENVVHSQGIERGLRKEILEREFEKICRYQKSGNPPISSLREVLDYLDRRN